MDAALMSGLQPDSAEPCNAGDPAPSPRPYTRSGVAAMCAPSAVSQERSVRAGVYRHSTDCDVDAHPATPNKRWKSLTSKRWKTHTVIRLAESIIVVCVTGGPVSRLLANTPWPWVLQSCRLPFIGGTDVEVGVGGGKHKDQGRCRQCNAVGVHTR